jgi:cell division septal protein FtsQ
MALRQKLVCVGLAGVLGLGGWLLIRSSALFSVQEVSIAGLTPSASPIVSDELIAAARTQATTSFSVAALRAAVARYTLVESVDAQADSAHAVRIEVVEREPVARLLVAHRSYLLAGDGTVVSGLADAGPLAVLHCTQAPAGGRTRDRFVLLALRVLSDAPVPLRERTAAVTLADGLLTIYLHRGPRLIFGNQGLLHAKWDAAAAVLAYSGARGADYIDLRVPSRPAAQVADPATSDAGASATTTLAGTPSGAATVATLLRPALIGPSSSTSG